MSACYPYLARRLFKDTDERTKVALKNMIYVDGDERRLNARRLVKLLRAFRTYTEQRVSKLDGGGAEGPGRGSLADNEVLREAVSVIFTTNENFIQEILLKEAARITDTAVREGFLRTAEVFQGFLPAPQRALDPFQLVLGPVLGASPAVRRQAEGLLAPLTSKADDDEYVLETITVLAELLQEELGGGPAGAGGPASTADLQQALAKAVPVLQELAPQLLPGALSSSAKFQRYLLARVSSRVLRDREARAGGDGQAPAA